jgi:hypothetical protein
MWTCKTLFEAKSGGGPMKQEEESMNKKDMVWSQLSLKADH